LFFMWEFFNYFVDVCERIIERFWEINILQNLRLLVATFIVIKLNYEQTFVFHLTPPDRLHCDGISVILISQRTLIH